MATKSLGKRMKELVEHLYKDFFEIHQYLDTIEEAEKHINLLTEQEIAIFNEFYDTLGRMKNQVILTLQNITNNLLQCIGSLKNLETTVAQRRWLVFTRKTTKKLFEKQEDEFENITALLRSVYFLSLKLGTDMQRLLEDVEKVPLGNSKSVNLLENPSQFSMVYLVKREKVKEILNKIELILDNIDKLLKKIAIIKEEIPLYIRQLRKASASFDMEPPELVKGIQEINTQMQFLHNLLTREEELLKAFA